MSHKKDVLVVLITCKIEEDPIKNKGARVVTRLYMYVDFFRRPRADNSIVSGEILTYSSIYACPQYLQESRRLIQK